MNYLFIDTSVSVPTISLIKDNTILFSYHDEIKSDMSSKILPIISNALGELSMNPNDIDKIFVVNGPGSFTGVRIGVTISKTLAWALNKKVIPVSSLEFIATTPTNKKYIVPMIDARRGNVFGAVYDNELNCIRKDSLINKEELLKDMNDDYEYVSFDRLEGVIYPNCDIVKIIQKHLYDETINPHDLKPNYLKLTEAEENRLKND